MRAPDKKERIQIPLMFAFREAFEKGDASVQEDVRIDGERVIADRGSLRRRGAEEARLKRDLGIDLAALVDTVALQSAEDLSAFPRIRKSILNYGIQDLTGVTVGSEAVDEIGENLKSALLQHEPRLNAATLTVERTKDEDEANERVRYRVRAEMICKPLDVPIEFVAEIDAASGKVVVPRLPGLV